MKFIVERTSMVKSKKPCEEAYEGYIDEIEEWEFHSFEEYNKRFEESGLLWENEGLNHKINSKGYIQRTFPNYKVWLIDINSLDDLINFNNKYGSIVIENYHSNENYKIIEIYDDYRE